MGGNVASRLWKRCFRWMEEDFLMAEERQGILREKDARADGRTVEQFYFCKKKYRL